MEEEKKMQSKTVDKAGTFGSLWFIGWLFTIGFAHLTLWKALVALLLWPYFLGVALRM